MDLVKSFTSTLQKIFALYAEKRQRILDQGHANAINDGEVYEEERFYNYFVFSVILPFLTDLLNEGHVSEICIQLT